MYSCIDNVIALKDLLLRIQMQENQQDGLPGKSERVLEFVWYTSQLAGK
jgi:hypothetical protein